MYESRLVEEAQAIQKLLRKYPYQCSTQAAELILLYQFVKIYAKQFKD